MSEDQTRPMLEWHHEEQAVQPDWEHTKRPRSLLCADHMYDQPPEPRQLHEEVTQIFDREDTSECAAVLSHLVARITHLSDHS
jgi:hypothetical protein